MLELNVTAFVTSANPRDFSGSIATHGKNAAKETYGAALEEAGESPLVSDPKDLEQVRAWLKAFGAWEPEEIAAWSPVELNALLIQYISGDLNEAQTLHPGDGPGGIDWDSYREDQESGRCSSMLFLAAGDKVYASIYE